MGCRLLEVRRWLGPRAGDIHVGIWRRREIVWKRSEAARGIWLGGENLSKASDIGSDIGCGPAKPRALPSAHRRLREAHAGHPSRHLPLLDRPSTPLGDAQQ